MNEKELFSNVCRYVIGLIDYEDYHNMGVENFHNWIREHYKPIPKSELIPGQEYNGICRNADSAIWDGTKFHYNRSKWGYTYNEDINHYEDDDGFDLFVPIKEIK